MDIYVMVNLNDAEASNKGKKKKAKKKKTKKQRKPKRFPNGRYKGIAAFTAKDIEDIRENDTMSRRELAREYGVHESTICRIKNGLTYRDVE